MKNSKAALISFFMAFASMQASASEADFTKEDLALMEEVRGMDPADLSLEQRERLAAIIAARRQTRLNTVMRGADYLQEEATFRRQVESLERAIALTERQRRIAEEQKAIRDAQNEGNANPVAGAQALPPVAAPAQTAPQNPVPRTERPAARPVAPEIIGVIGEVGVFRLGKEVVRASKGELVGPYTVELVRPDQVTFSVVVEGKREQFSISLVF